MMFGEGQMMFWEGPNCPKKSNLSLQRHRDNVKILHCLEGPNHGSRAFGKGYLWPRCPPPPTPTMDAPMGRLVND